MPDERTGSTGYHSDVMSAVIQASTCACGAPDCVFRPRHLVPLRDHIARLYHIIGLANYERCLQDCSDHSWSAVTYHLQMAGSIEDLTADTGYVDLTSSRMMCRPAREYEARHSVLASRYAAALAIFNFLWAAYEGAIKAGASTFLPKASTTFRARELMKQLEYGAKSMACVTPISVHAAAIVLRVGDLDEERPQLGRFAAGSAEFAAELVRIFRNHIAHGSDSPPEPDVPGDEWRAVRFYSVARILLLLIQLIAAQALIPGDPHYDHPDEDDEYEGHQRSLREVLLSLQFEACDV